MDNQLMDKISNNSSPFCIIEGQEAPKLRSPLVPYILGIPLLSVICAGYVLLLGTADLLKQIGLLFIISIGLAYMIISSRQRRRRFEAIQELLGSLCLDLESLHNSLDTYLRRLDARASRCFNSMTPSESAIRYFLSQIATALEHRVRKIRYFLCEPRHDNIRAAYQYLQTPLRIRESVVEKEGKHKLIALKDLRVISNNYVQNLESVLCRIEKETSEKDYDVVLDDYNNED